VLHIPPTWFNAQFKGVTAPHSMGRILYQRPWPAQSLHLTSCEPELTLTLTIRP